VRISHTPLRNAALRRAGVLALTLGAAAAANAAVPAAAASSSAPAAAAPQTVFCSANVGPSGLIVFCGGSGVVSVTLVCTTGTVSDLFFAPGTVALTCPSGGTVVRWSLNY